uniref:Uncharacterized protein n=1 Tax=Lactuca sativa TaxID=4236 RepID=A0A9R1XLA5_LACSA|nr:hypothetical protein LSAT_V11C300148590 [Lactuca sativa]
MRLLIQDAIFRHAWPVLMRVVLQKDEVAGNLAQLHNSAAALWRVDLHHLSLHTTHYCLRKVLDGETIAMMQVLVFPPSESLNKVRLLTNKGIYEQRQKDNRGVVIVHHVE